MTDHEQFWAYIATLVALVLVLMGALMISAFVPAVMGKLEVFGLGTVTGGLIGILRMPTKPSASVGTADSVNVNTPPPTNGA